MKVKSIFTFMASIGDRLYELAEPQAGYFTTAQARTVGVSKQELYYLRQRGDLLKVAHGIQRLARFPATKHEDIVIACLWAGPDAVASHSTATVVYGIGDAMPVRIHVTTPWDFRGKRNGVVVHHAVLSDTEVSRRDGIPVTSPLRTIADVAKGDVLGATDALSDALDRGLLNPADLSEGAELYPEVRTLFLEST